MSTPTTTSEKSSPVLRPDSKQLKLKLPRLPISSNFCKNTHKPKMISMKNKNKMLFSQKMWDNAYNKSKPLKSKTKSRNSMLSPSKWKDKSKKSPISSTDLSWTYSNSILLHNSSKETLRNSHQIGAKNHKNPQVKLSTSTSKIWQQHLNKCNNAWGMK